MFETEKDTHFIYCKWNGKMVLQKTEKCVTKKNGQKTMKEYVQFYSIGVYVFFLCVVSFRCVYISIKCVADWIDAHALVCMHLYCHLNGETKSEKSENHSVNGDGYSGSWLL